MRRTTKLLELIVFVLPGTTLLLDGCHTVAGTGADVAHAGHAVEKSANKHAP